MKMNSRIILVLMVIMIGWPLQAFASDKPADKPADNMKFVLEKLHADKRLLIASNMQLTESESKKFWPLYDKYQDELFLLRSRSLKLISDYANAYKKMTDKTAKKLLDEFMTIEKLKLKLREAYVPKFRKILSDIKTVRYFQLENKINAALMFEMAAKIPLIKDAK